MKATIGSKIFSGSAWAELRRALRLSGRELDVVRAIFDDRTEFSTACQLSISRRTVHTYVERLYRKIGTVDRVQVVLRVVQEFLTLTSSKADRLPPICPKAGECAVLRKRP